MDERIRSDDTIKTLEEDRIRLQTELDLVKRDLDERNRDLHKERVRIEKMIRQEQVIDRSFIRSASFLSSSELSIGSNGTVHVSRTSHARIRLAQVGTD